MKKEVKLFKFAGLQVSAVQSALVGSLLLWLALVVLALWLLYASLGQALLGGLVAVLLHWFSELFHNWGHARAARSTGYPMTGVRLWFMLGTSLYPPDEPELPAAVHQRRAWGGPIASFGLSLVAGFLTSALHPLGGLAWWLAAFLFLDNLLFFTLGAFLPLDFTDGGTLLTWREKG